MILFSYKGESDHEELSFSTYLAGDNVFAPAFDICVPPCSPSSSKLRRISVCKPLPPRFEETPIRFIAVPNEVDLITSEALFVFRKFETSNCIVIPCRQTFSSNNARCLLLRLGDLSSDTDAVTDTCPFWVPDPRPQLYAGRLPELTLIALSCCEFTLRRPVTTNNMIYLREVNPFANDQEINQPRTLLRKCALFPKEG